MMLLELRNLTRAFGSLKAADGIDLDLADGAALGIIGPNGAGKTTVINMISRLLEPRGGRVVFDGQDLLAIPAHGVIGRGIARTFQNLELFEHATVMQNLLLGRHTHRSTDLFAELLFLPGVRAAERQHRERVEAVIDFLDLQRHRDSMVSGLPYGVRKMVELGRALASQPRLVLLDEPAAGLNPEETENLAFWIEDMVADLGVTILMVEHDLALVNEVSDRVLVMNQGQAIARGTPEEVQREPAVIEAYLGA
ncbi:MAG: ABC transporter ATP-binding protein [Alphaproteobacteria bacterium]